MNGRACGCPLPRIPPIRLILGQNLHEICLGVLRALYVLQPFVYGLILAVLYSNGIGRVLGQWAFASVSCALILSAAGAAIGILKRKIWGLSLGYALAVVNLVVFPVGTLAGLLLLVALVGASPAFKGAPRLARK